jgi:XTP/dITP diphosphohydrolase
MKLVFASNNNHKVDEVRSAAGGNIEIITMQEAGVNIDIPEPFETLEENAAEKSRTIYHLTGLDCFADDSGLEVDALGGEPGVKSARYAGDERSFEKNIDKLLHKLEKISERTARFRTVISLLLENKEYIFEGVCKGRITRERKGSGGFGYDPVFLPDGATHTFAEMNMEEKNRLSHRKKAMDKLVTFLKQQDIKPKI